MFRHLLLAIFFVTLSHSLLFAQTEVLSGEILPAALTRCWQMMGGPVISGDTHAEGSLIRDGQRLELKIKTRGLEQTRTEINSAGETLVIVGGKGSAFRIREGKREKMKNSRSAHFRPEFLPVQACAGGAQARAIDHGTSEVEGRTVRHLEVYEQGLAGAAGQERLMSTQHVFIDEQSGRAVKLQNYIFSPEALENSSVWEVRFSDYRTVDGVQVPFRMQRFIDGVPHSEVQLSRVTVNTSIAISDFQ